MRGRRWWRKGGWLGGLAIGLVGYESFVVDDSIYTSAFGLNFQRTTNIQLAPPAPAPTPDVSRPDLALYYDLNPLRE